MDIRSFVILTFFIGCQATLFFDLDKVFNINPSNPPSDTTVVVGPEGVGKALVYSSNAPPVVREGSTPAYLISTLVNSDDFTYYTWFKMPSRNLNKREEWMFFTLQDKSSMAVLFGVGLRSISKSGQGSEDESTQGDFVQVISIKQFTTYDKITKSHDIPLTEEFKPDTWYELMIRIKVKEASQQDAPPANARKRRATSKFIVPTEVKVGCNSIWTGNLPDGKFANYLPNGYAVFSSSLKRDSRKPLIAENRFPGALSKSQIINGFYSYAFYSPCDADTSVQVIPDEPLPSEYSDAKLKLYERMVANVQPVSLTCPGQVPTRYNGEAWIVDRCNQFECKAGKVYEKWICPDELCENKYKKGDKWVDPKDSCILNECIKDFEEIKSEKINCKEITKCPDGFPPVKLESECCKKCRSDTCTAGRTYYEGCKRTCKGGSQFVCESKKPGCWCPAGQVEDKDGKCIPLNTCPCVSGNVVYQPGQSAVRSSCSSCVCLDGTMACFERC